MSKYFNLTPECYLIIGGNRSAVYNLDTGAIVALNEEQTRAMTLAETKTPIEDDAAVYEYLAGKGWGFYSYLVNDGYGSNRCSSSRQFCR